MTMVGGVWKHSSRPELKFFYLFFENVLLYRSGIDTLVVLQKKIDLWKYTKKSTWYHISCVSPSNHNHIGLRASENIAEFESYTALFYRAVPT